VHDAHAELAPGRSRAPLGPPDHDGAVAGVDDLFGLDDGVDILGELRHELAVLRQAGIGPAPRHLSRLYASISGCMSCMMLEKCLRVYAA
jgi:hypothetical protein